MEVDDLIAKYESPHAVPPTPALEGLDEVNWAALKDAYGPATNVPALLRAFVSVDPGDREFVAESGALPRPFGTKVVCTLRPQQPSRSCTIFWRTTGRMIRQRSQG